MKTAIVIPCLNEARLVGRTARSLGFGADIPADRDTHLILVDNGSTDETWATIAAIRDQAPPGAVHLAREDERGYVPPRHRGTQVASQIAERHGVSTDDLLILQGDADTVYQAGYVDGMRQAAQTAGTNHILEARVHQPRRFQSDHPGFQNLADRIDAEMAPHFVDDADDVIVDDKAAGFRLGDYLRWGGHRRDYMSTGTEVHAETTRLFIRARRVGGRKIGVNAAWAVPSRRKIQRNPVRHFATAGFPREDAWWREWNAHYTGARNLPAFDDSVRGDTLAPAISMRRAHLLSLFSTIPRAVKLGLSDRNPSHHDGDYRIRAAVEAIRFDRLGRLFELLLPTATNSA
jgi:glycosyltransferase involved in cell wall biosynthesis